MWPSNETYVSYLKEIGNGFYHGQGTLAETLLEWERAGIFPYHLDISGTNINSKLDFQNEIGFIISDDQPFNENELEVLSKVEKISVGKKWIQGHSVIAILHYYLD